MEDSSDPTPLKIAAAQVQAVCGDVQANVATVVEMLECAQQEGVKLIVFPELFLSGEEPDLVRLDPSEHAIHPNDPRLAPIVEACDRTSVAAIIGAATCERANLYNSLLVFSASGELSATYHKQHLSASERDIYTPGDLAYVLYWAGWNIAVGISCDVAFPDHARSAAGMDCHAYLVGARFGSDAGYREAREWMAARARDNVMYVLLANHIGVPAPEGTCGNSAAWAPDGQLLVEAPGPGKHLVSTTLAFPRLREAGLREPMTYEQLQARRMRRPRFDTWWIQSLRERRGENYIAPSFVAQTSADFEAETRAMVAEMIAHPKPPSAEQLAQWAESDRMKKLLCDGLVEELEREAATHDGFPHAKDNVWDDPWICKAIDYGAFAAIEWMIAKGVDLSFVNGEGYSAAMLALERESPDKYAILDLLLRSGAPTDRHGINFWTAMHLAAVRNDVEGLRILRKYGADLRAISYDYDTSTPAEDARRANSWKALAFLDQMALEDGLPPG